MIISVRNGGGGGGHPAPPPPYLLRTLAFVLHKKTVLFAWRHKSIMTHGLCWAQLKVSHKRTPQKSDPILNTSDNVFLPLEKVALSISLSSWAFTSRSSPENCLNRSSASRHSFCSGADFTVDIVCIAGQRSDKLNHDIYFRFGENLIQEDHIEELR